MQDIKHVEFNVSKKVFFLSSSHKIIIVRMFELNELMWFEFFILYSIIWPAIYKRVKCRNSLLNCSSDLVALIILL